MHAVRFCYEFAVAFQNFVESAAKRITFLFMTFKAIIHPESTGGFWGEVPSLPGCYSQAETVDQLIINLREAATGYLQILADEGRSPERQVEIAELAV
jgi:predicted RNase H-like HicB family nuclease